MLEFIQTTFAGLDTAAFEFMSGLQQSAGDMLTPLMKIISFLGEKGLLFIVIGLCCILFSKQRKLGICIIGAVAIGAIITNIALKNIVARPRPFTLSEFEGFWVAVGSPMEDEFSFPSGHTTAITAAATALFIQRKKAWSWIGYIFALLMAFSRVYLIVHFASDVIAGLIVGIIAGVLSALITKLIYSILNKRQNKLSDFALKADFPNLFVKKEYKDKE